MIIIVFLQETIFSSLQAGIRILAWRDGIEGGKPGVWG